MEILMLRGRRTKLIVVALLLVAAAGSMLAFYVTRRPTTKWPPDSDEERFALAFAAHDRERRLDTLSQILQMIGIDVEDRDVPSVDEIAREIVVRDGQEAIPLLIGVIDADNSYETVYRIGYSVMWLGDLTREVGYSHFHDGAWWRRWWEAHKQEYPAEVQAIPIPEFDKSDHGRTYKSFPESFGTLAGKMELAAELLGCAKTPSDHGCDLSGIRFQDVVGEIAEFDDPRTIPFLIGLMEADNPRAANSCDHGLAKLAGVAPSIFHDSAWWRRWWTTHRQDFPADVQSVPIPTFEQTETGTQYVPFPEDVDTMQGKLRQIVLTLFETQKLMHSGKASPDILAMPFGAVAIEIAKHHDPHAIPYLIGLIAADNTHATIYGVGYFGLGFGHPPLTTVSYRESHDGPWWRKWWQDHKADYPAEVAAIEIPDYQAPLTFGWQESPAPSNDADPNPGRDPTRRSRPVKQAE